MGYWRAKDRRCKHIKAMEKQVGKCQDIKIIVRIFNQINKSYKMKKGFNNITEKVQEIRTIQNLKEAKAK